MSNYRIIEIPEEITLTLKDIATALRRSEDDRNRSCVKSTHIRHT